MCLALGPVLRMRTRCLKTVINEACYWDERVASLKKLYTEFVSGSRTLTGQMAFQFWPASPLVNVVSYSDTSEFSWGWYIVISRDSIAKVSFAETEIDTGCTYRELKLLYIFCIIRRSAEGKSSQTSFC